MVWRGGGRRREWSESRMARREKEEEGAKRMARSEGIERKKHAQAAMSVPTSQGTTGMYTP